MSAAHERITRFREDFPLFAETCLKILDKDAKIIPLVFNTPQKIVHEAVETQKREKGWVRALVLKARKQGVSTYVQARNYHRTTLWPHQHSYILTHEQPATEVIFDIVDRYQRHNAIAPVVGTSNAKELSFSKIQSSYTVATAGTKAGGRGGTPRFFHGSEVAFWPNAKDHFKGSVNAVPDSPGTEIILESTANGTSGEFYGRWHDAIAGRGDYIAIFVPWFASPEYSRVPEEGFELNPEAEEGELSECEYAELFNLSDAQMCWRRSKILGVGGPNAFRQEFPATPDEAFVSADKESYIDPLTVLRARKRKILGADGPLIIGADPAGGNGGGDRFAVAWRRGAKVLKVEYRDKITATEAVSWLRDIIERDKPARMFVDSGGLGSPIITFLKAASPQCAKVVVGVNFGAKSQHRNARPTMAGPKLRKHEMWMRLKQWLSDPDNPAQIPDVDALQTDITGPWRVHDNNNDLVLATKAQMLSKGIKSPDLADAIALTFAESVWVEPAKHAAQDPSRRDQLDTGTKESYGHDFPPFRGTPGSSSSWMS